MMTGGARGGLVTLVMAIRRLGLVPKQALNLKRSRIQVSLGLAKC